MRLHLLHALLVSGTLLTAQGNQDPNLMDYGPFVSATVGAPWPADNVTLKGIAVRLKGGGVLFDTELLRVSAGWTGGYLNFTGTPYDGAHGGYPTIKGKMLFGTRVAPGFAKDAELEKPHEARAAFADPRSIPHGPIPREWGRYEGVYLNDDRVVVSYRIGTTGVLETYDTESIAGETAITRTLELAPGPALRLVLGEHPEAESSTQQRGFAVLKRKAPAVELVTRERVIDGWETLSQAAPSAHDYADASSGNGVTFTCVESFGKPHQNAGAKENALPRLNDGLAQENGDNVDRSVFFDGDRARVVADLGKSISIARVSTFSWHRGDRSPQSYEFYGSDAAQCPDTKGDKPLDAGWKRIAVVNTKQLGTGGQHAARIQERGKALATCRWLLFDIQKATKSGTFFSEIDVVEQGAEPDLPVVVPEALNNVAIVRDAPDGTQLRVMETTRVVLDVPARKETTRIKLVHWDGPESRFRPVWLACEKGRVKKAIPLEPLTHGGKKRHPGKLAVTGVLGKGNGAYVVDTIPVPEENPWLSRMRCAAFDFFSDGKSAAVSTWNGDVWLVQGIDDKLEHVTWKRFATGLFDPLGLRIVDDHVFTLGRDQITKLHDENGDDEADFYECFNNDVITTAAFHEFAFDLQTDKEGNFYFAKAGPVRNGGRGFEKIVPHHGAILKVDKDGKSIEVYATGLRAPNGIGVSPDGIVTSGDNEGTWMPRCRLNWILPGSFQGCADTSHRDPKPTGYDPPLCFMPMEVDNSGGGQVWVTSDKWGPFGGDLLHLSYGTCTLYKAMKHEVDGTVQGGVTAFPLSFHSSLMRGRFHPTDGQLYVIGFKGWQTSAAWEAAFERVRFTGKPVRMAKELHVEHKGVAITFTDELDAKTANDPASWDVSQWNYLWTQSYGSPEVSLKKPAPDFKNMKDVNDFKDRDAVVVKSATLRADQRTVFLELEEVVPVMQMKIAYNVDAKDGGEIKGAIHCSIHKVPADK